MATMKLTHEEDNFLVIDDLLSPEALNKVHDQLECDTYNAINYGEDKVYRFNSGPIYKSINKYWSQDGPWKNNYEPFRLQLLETLSTIDSIPKDWSDKISMMVHAYYSGAELGWHRDIKAKASYSFYAHQQWHPMWAGNLLVADPRTRHSGQASVTTPSMDGTALKDSFGKDYGQRGVTFDHNLERETLFEPGMGTFVIPKPNRLVILRNQCFHKVERVDPAAGMAARVSLTGFFA